MFDKALNANLCSGLMKCAFWQPVNGQDMDVLYTHGATHGGMGHGHPESSETAVLLGCLVKFFLRIVIVEGQISLGVEYFF